MNLTILKGYSNYSDRIIRKEDTVFDYVQKSKDYISLPDVRNFNPADGVDTTQIISLEKKPLLDEWSPDYLIVDNDGIIISRWFVIESKRTRARQCVLSLHRDVLADNWPKILSAPVYVERGMLPRSDAFIYNHEGIDVNQIKRLEHCLRDPTRLPWIVAYVSKNFGHDLKQNETRPGTEAGVTLEKEIPQDVHSHLVSFTINQQSIQHPDALSWSALVGQNPLLEEIIEVPVAGAARVKKQFIHQSYVGTGHDLHDKLTFALISNVLSRPYPDTGHLEKYLFMFEPEWATHEIQRMESFKRSFYKEPDHYLTVGGPTLKDVEDDFYVLLYRTIWGNIQSRGGKQNVGFLQAITDDADRGYHWLEPSQWNLSNTPIYNVLRGLNNKWIDFGDGRYQKFTFREAMEQDVRVEFDYVRDRAQNLAYNYLKALFPTRAVTETELSTRPRTVFGQLVEVCDIFGGSLSELWSGVQNDECHFTLKDSTGATPARENIDDAFNILTFPLPYGGTSWDTVLHGSQVGWTRNLDRKFFMILAHELSKVSGIVYDVQLLPYCPISNLDYSFEQGRSRLHIELKDLTEGVDYLKILDRNDQWLSTVFFSSNSSGTFNIDQLPAAVQGYLNNVSDPVDCKVKNDTELVRLVSPNYNGIFDMIPVRNGGVYAFNVDFTYKPFTPYIHVNPVFNQHQLYGRDFNDARGLICGGDFSLSQISDRWKEYEIQNKNYQQIFNRTIQRMDETYTIEHQKAVIGAVTGGMTGAAGGLAGGALAGSAAGPVGTVLGAVAGGVAGVALGTVGGVMDLKMLEKSYEINRRFAIDNFALQIGNVKALPDVIRRVSAFNENNKVFPFIEVYSCTPEEVDAYKEKLRYNGMAVGRIDTLSTFVAPNVPVMSFIKGHLIRLEGVDDDAHVHLALTDELERGVFIDIDQGGSEVED